MEDFLKTSECPNKFHSYSYYYEILRGLTNDLEMWQTDYIQRMPNHIGVVEWYKGSGMRNYLSSLPGESERMTLLSDFEQALEKVYPKEKDGVVLMPMRRLFFIAYRH